MGTPFSSRGEMPTGPEWSPRSPCQEVCPSTLLIHQDKAQPSPAPHPHPQGAPGPLGTWQPILAGGGFLKQRLVLQAGSECRGHQGHWGSGCGFCRGPARGSDQENADKPGCAPPTPAKACLGVLGPEGGIPRAISAPPPASIPGSPDPRQCGYAAPGAPREGSAGS